jgi:hypothetical protein
VDANAEPHLLGGKSIGILLGYGILHRDSTLHGIHGAGEIGDKTVASGTEDPASMRGYQAINDDPVSCQRAKGADLIESHQAAVAFDIGCEDRRELSFDGVLPRFGTSLVEYSPNGREIRGSVNHSEARW